MRCTSFSSIADTIYDGIGDEFAFKISAPKDDDYNDSKK
jgi:hypothetical protein